MSFFKFWQSGYRVVSRKIVEVSVTHVGDVHAHRIFFQIEFYSTSLVVCKIRYTIEDRDCT